ncbi:MAG TPA: KH domain-containing protein [Candidatus Dormibacteraeota bacterium]|nr:KH domain-containing protein [Candidatus Dormibacteraeota bacterium]
MSDEQRSRPPRRDFRRGGGGGGFNRGFRRDRPASSGPSIDYRALVEYVARSLAEKPEEVSVESFDRGGGTVAIKVKLADGDVGRFIGKAGRNIEAIRTLVRVASLRDHKRVFVDLANPSLAHDGSQRPPRRGGSLA